ncbi:hypothetical protein MY1884_004602 [Beauveria asiatica]
MAQLVGELGITQVAGNHNAWYTGAFHNDARPMRYAVEKLSELIKELQEVAPSSTSGLNMSTYAIASYGTQSAAKIRAAADKYDAYGVFQSLRVSGFKIPKHHSKTEL